MFFVSLGTYILTIVTLFLIFFFSSNVLIVINHTTFRNEKKNPN